MRIGQDSAIAFLSQVATSLFGFVATVYLARTLGPGPLGIYYLVTATVIWIKAPVGAGIGNAIKKRISESEQQGEFIAAGLMLQLAALVVIALTLFLLQDIVTKYLRGVDIGLVVLILTVTLTLSLITSILDGLNRVHLSAILSPLDRGVRSMFQIGLVVLGLGLAGLVYGYLIGAAVATVVGVAFVSVRLRRPNTSHAKSLISYARYSWLGGLSSRAFSSMDTLILGLFVVDSLIGVYVVTWNLASILAVFGTSVRRALFPRMSALSGDEHDEVESLMTHGLRYSGLFLIPGLVGGLVVGKTVLSIYGSEFSTGYFVLVILIVARLLYGYSATFTTALNAIDRPDITFRIDIAFVVTNVGLNLVLVSQFGWLGAAFATAFSAALVLGYGYYAVRGFLNINIPILDIIRQAVAAGVMGAIVYVGRGYTSRSVLAAIILVSLGAFVYLATLMSISSTFRATVRRNLNI